MCKMQKETAFLLIALFLTSAVVPALAQPSVLQPSQVSTHGPLINKLVYTYMSDSSAFLALQSGKIQLMEWTLSLTNYETAQQNHNLYTNSTPTYAFDGIAFNCLVAPINNTHFRRAIAYLTNYEAMQSDLSASVDAGPQLFNPILYPTYYAASLKYPYAYNTTAAMRELLEIPGMQYIKSKGEWLYQGQPFEPTLYYRSDDPLRTEGAQLLAKAAAQINLTIALKSVTDQTASTIIYDPAAAAVISEGVMGSNYSTIKLPQINWTYAKENDQWDMYTVGWIVSAEPTWPAYFFASEYAGIVDFGNFINSSMDYWANYLLYGASNVSVAKEATYQIQAIFNQQLPYVMWFYEPQLYAVDNATWAGYALIASTGPTESTGLYYTALNVHPVGQAHGGTFTDAIHGAPTALDPLYVTNWIWQADIWQMIYDSPIGTPPTAVTSMGTMPWMATWTIQNDTTAAIGSGPGWYNPFNASKIVKGQIITLNFFHNLTWQDGVPVTAYDYNFSLYLWNVAGVNSADTPLAYTATPPYGLLATYIPPNNPYQIQLYVNSTNLWNLFTLDDDVFPMHIFKWFNPSAIATPTSALDTTLPITQVSGYQGLLLSNKTQLPAYVTFLPNLEVGSGAFYMPYGGWDKTTEVITLLRNIHYYRSAWWAFSQSGVIGKPFAVTEKINESIYNPTSSAFLGIAPGSNGTIPITNATGYAAIVANGTHQVLAEAPLVNLGGGLYTASIPTATLSPGLYEVVFNATYTSFGLKRYWYTFTGADLVNELSSLTNFQISKTTITAGQPINISVTAVSAAGKPMAGQKVTFLANGTVIGSAITGASGIASITFTPTKSGKWQISAQSATNTSIATTPAQLEIASPTNWALYGGIAVVIIVVIAVAAFLAIKRGKGAGTAQQNQAGVQK